MVAQFDRRRPPTLMRIDAIQNDLLEYWGIPPYSPITIHSRIPDIVDGRTILVLWAPGGETRLYKVKVSLTINAPGVGLFDSETQKHGPR